MVGAGYLADQGRKAGPLLTVICAAVFLASGLAGVFEALLLSQEADTLAKAPVCSASAVSADCRLHLQGTVVGGYDEGSGLTPERHIDVKASSLNVLHLDSPIVGAPPQIGSAVELEYPDPGFRIRYHVLDLGARRRERILVEDLEQAFDLLLSLIVLSERKDVIFGRRRRSRYRHRGSC